MLIRTVVLFLLVCVNIAESAGQPKESINSIRISGRILDSAMFAVSGATISVTGSKAAATSDVDGNFQLELPAAKRYKLVITSVGFEAKEIEAVQNRNGFPFLEITLAHREFGLTPVEVHKQSVKAEARENAFAVDVVNTKQIRDRNADLNRLLDGMPGVRVRESGGIGSSFTYSLNGLSGKSVRVFVDGIPMESFGAGFSINNYPVTAIDKIEVFKGVTPIQLGSDALGGAINIITRKDVRDFADISYSYGSFNTHRASFSGRFRLPSNGFTFSATASYNNSANNYKVWGRTVEVADQYGRPVPGNIRYRRFNDDFESIAARAEIGFTNTKWADKATIALNYSELAKGLQTGRTMAFVYGDVRYNEKFVLPSLQYAKQNLFTRGLNADLFIGYTNLEGTTTDTGSRKYNWAQTVINDNVEGELNGIRSQKSIYTFRDKGLLSVLNLSYQLNESTVIRFNNTINNITRKGSDQLGVAEWTIPFREPQEINRQIAAVAIEKKVFDDRWTNTLFVKYFRYSAVANVYDYNGTSQKELIRKQSSDDAFGAGYATRFFLTSNQFFKFSAEKTARLPDASELLGDGNTILNSPDLKPERSLNLNVSAHRIIEAGKARFNIDLGLFFRNTEDLIWLGEGDLYGTARYENVDKIRSTGAELSISYSNNKWLEISGNATYQDVRNRLRYIRSGAANIVFNDKMKNMPSFMANAEVKTRHYVFAGKSVLSVYLNTHYVEQYFLGWPSLGSRTTKKTIPEQFVQDAGLILSDPLNRKSISIECRNLLDKQVYDNYLLQKPGRYLNIKLRYSITKSGINQ